MRLGANDVRILLKAMEDSFDQFNMQRLLLERFRLSLHTITGVLKPFRDQVTDIHTHFDQRNTTEQLIAALRDARPSVIELVNLADHAGFLAAPSLASLEVFVRKEGEPYQDVLAFRASLSKREAAVCRVETPTAYGTGALIGPDLVLTNHHVIASDLDQSGKLIGKIHCLFDFKQSATGYTTPGARVAVTTVLAHSPYAPEDVNPPAINTALDKLDYALLKIERRIGDEPIVDGGDIRGFVPIPEPTRSIGMSEGLLILQHPKAKPMKIDIGAVTWSGATRLRHSVNTQGGSSGSPIFDSGLNLVAVHHAGHDWPGAEYPYNQGVPIALIIADVRARGLQI